MILEQDPLNIPFRSVYGWILAFAGQADRALAEVCKALEIDAGLWMTHYAACLAHILLERLDEAGESAERAVSLAPWQPMLAGILAASWHVAANLRQRKICWRSARIRQRSA